MKDILFSEDIVPIGEFKAKAAYWLEKIKKTGHPIVITQNGKPAGVLVSPLDFDRTLEKERFIDSIAKGLADAETGRTLSTEEMRCRLLDLGH
ncbi:MAG: prevent-host-death family protein [Alphaproteobacteria bacterium]|jgi:prevent-host-death family protein|nr:prevent-host-death family protein [Alphaproteobacteria bacterium]